MNKENIQISLRQVWNYIGSDYLEAFDTPRGMKQSEVIEICLDADRMESICDKEFQEDIVLFRQLPYKKQVAMAKKAFPFKYYS